MARPHRFMLLTALLMLVVATLTPASRLSAQGLVTRDDFLAHDTIYGVPGTARWPCIAIDESGFIYQTNMLDSNYNYEENNYVTQFNRFDAQGNQLQPVVNFVPTNLWAGSQFYYVAMGSRAYIEVNDFGATFIGEGNLESVVPSNLFYPVAFLYDKSGTQSKAICLNCDQPDQYGWYCSFVRGGINNAGVMGAFYRASPDGWGHHFYPYIRFYYPQSDSLSPLLEIPFRQYLPTDLTDTAWSGVDYQYDLKVADDGSFAAAWVVQNFGQGHLFYAVYNADHSVRKIPTICDCDSLWYDTTQCVGYDAADVSMAMEADGDFYLAWTAIQYSPYCDVRDHVWMQGFHADGTPKYERIRVNDADSLWMWTVDKLAPQIACDNAGNVLVAWADARDFPVCMDYPPRNLYAQKISPGGELVGVNHRINNADGTLSSWPNHDVDLNNSGQAVFAWNSSQTPRIAAQLMPYDSIGHFVPGDITWDMKATVADLTRFVSYLFLGQYTSFWPRNLLDFNQDNQTGNVADLTYLVNYLFKGGPEPAVPDAGVRPNPGKARASLGDSVPDSAPLPLIRDGGKSPDGFPDRRRLYNQIPDAR